METAITICLITYITQAEMYLPSTARDTLIARSWLAACFMTDVWLGPHNSATHSTSSPVSMWIIGNLTFLWINVTLKIIYTLSTLQCQASDTSAKHSQKINYDFYSFWHPVERADASFWPEAYLQIKAVFDFKDLCWESWKYHLLTLRY